MTTVNNDPARLSSDGQFVTAFDSSSGGLIHDRIRGVTSRPPGASGWFFPTLSGNGRYVVSLDVATHVIVTANPLSP